jgi:hypothetical protein
MCLNEFDENGELINFDIYGPDEPSSHRRLDIEFRPCHPERLTEQNKHLKDELCLADMDQENWQ